MEVPLRLGCLLSRIIAVDVLSVRDVQCLPTPIHYIYFFFQLLGFNIYKAIFSNYMPKLEYQFCLFGLRLFVPVNNFSVMSGLSHSFLVITSTFWEVNVSCSKIQHGDLSEDRTPDLLLWSLMLYH